LSHGDLTLETSTGKLNTIILSTHTVLLMRPAATTLSHPTERLEQDLDKQLALIRISDAWKTCQLLNKKEYWEKLGMSCLHYFDIDTGKLKTFLILQCTYLISNFYNLSSPSLHSPW